MGLYECIEGFPGGISVKDYLPANAGDMRDMGSIPGLGRSPEGGHNNPLQNSCLENSTNRGAAVRRVAKNQTPEALSRQAKHECVEERTLPSEKTPCPVVSTRHKPSG